eukprot:s7789_g1.t2
MYLSVYVRTWQAQLQRERHRRDGGIGVALQRADGPLWTAHAEVDPILGDCAPSQDSSAEEEEFPGDLRPPCEESNQARWHEKEQWYQEPWYEDVKVEHDWDWWRQQPAEEKKLDARAQETRRDWQTGDYLHQQRQKESHQADMAKFASLLNRHNLPREAAGTPATRSSPTKTSLDGQSVEATQKPDTRQQPQEIREEEAPPVEEAESAVGQKLIVRHKFDGREYGDSYLVLQKGDVLIFLREESEWAFCRREQPGAGPLEGWFPPNFAQKIAEGADAEKDACVLPVVPLKLTILMPANDWQSGEIKCIAGQSQVAQWLKMMHEPTRSNWEPDVREGMRLRLQVPVWLCLVILGSKVCAYDLAFYHHYPDNVSICFHYGLSSLQSSVGPGPR